MYSDNWYANEESLLFLTKIEASNSRNRLINYTMRGKIIYSISIFVITVVESVLMITVTVQLKASCGTDMRCLDVHWKLMDLLMNQASPLLLPGLFVFYSHGDSCKSAFVKSGFAGNALHVMAAFITLTVFTVTGRAKTNRRPVG